MPACSIAFTAMTTSWIELVRASTASTHGRYSSSISRAETELVEQRPGTHDAATRTQRRRRGSDLRPVRRLRAAASPADHSTRPGSCCGGHDDAFGLVIVLQEHHDHRRDLLGLALVAPRGSDSPEDTHPTLAKCTGRVADLLEPLCAERDEQEREQSEHEHGAEAQQPSLLTRNAGAVRRIEELHVEVRVGLHAIDQCMRQRSTPHDRHVRVPGTRTHGECSRLRVIGGSDRDRRLLVASRYERLGGGVQRTTLHDDDDVRQDDPQHSLRCLLEAFRPWGHQDRARGLVGLGRAADGHEPDAQHQDRHDQAPRTCRRSARRSSIRSTRAPIAVTRRSPPCPTGPPAR